MLAVQLVVAVAALELVPEAVQIRLVFEVAVQIRLVVGGVVQS